MENLKKDKDPCLFSRAAALLIFLSLLHRSYCSDADVMLTLKQSLKIPATVKWSDPNPCKWDNVRCNSDQVVSIQLGNLQISGTLPPSLSNLTSLQRFEVQNNLISGSISPLAGLPSLQYLLLNNNSFTSIPSNFFQGMSSLQAAYLDQNPFQPWVIPASLQGSTALNNFSANSANVEGSIPDFFGPDGLNQVANLHLAFNNLTGGLPGTFAGSSIQTLWLNGQSGSKLSGRIDVLANMTELTHVWLHSNSFTGPIPDLSSLVGLKDLSLRDNQLTGPVPASLTSMSSLQVVNLTNNLLQGPIPVFDGSVAVDNAGTNSFCGNASCDSRIQVLLSIAEPLGYPVVFAENWKGNDPCASSSWLGIQCSHAGNITGFSFHNRNLTGTISPAFSQLTGLERLELPSNNLTGTIPIELTSLPQLVEVDLSNNHLYGKMPSFRSNVVVNTSGNPDIGRDKPSTPSSSPGTSPGGSGGSSGSGKKKTIIIAVAVVGAVIGICVVILGLCWCRNKQKHLGRVQSPNTMVIHPRFSGSDQDAVKITLAGLRGNGAAMSESTYSHASSGPNDIHVVEAGNMVISIQVLREVTDNFSEKNVLGRGGFGTVYKGELHDGTMIAVKRMESGLVSDKGLNEFTSEIAVLTKVRHRHLVALLGYCLDGNERLLVYEYMPQGTLSRHIFNWKDEGLKPLEWAKRLTIALDVARGVEYLHSLAHQSFIHRDLKPSNILLGDDMRAKVADFGLVRLAPDGKASFATKLAGTFGYLAPEYAVTGRVTTKVDVFSFGVILMELITGRKALDESRSEDNQHLVTWFRRMSINKDSFQSVIDPTLHLDEEILASINKVSELAGHCSTREPHQRPDMSHVVNVLSSLAELWKPSDPDAEDIYGIDLDMTLPQALKKWQAFEGNSNIDDSTSSFPTSSDNTQTSIPTRPSGFADSFTSADGR